MVCLCMREATSSNESISQHDSSKNNSRKNDIMSTLYKSSWTGTIDMSNMVQAEIQNLKKKLQALSLCPEDMSCGDIGVKILSEYRLKA